MKNFLYLCQASLLQNSKLVSGKSWKRLVFSAVTTIICFFILDITVSLNMSMTINKFIAADYNFISSDVLPFLYGIMSIIVIALHSFITYNFAIYTKSERILIYPIKGTKLFYAKYFGNLIFYISLLFLPLIANFFLIVGSNQTNVYSYFSSIIYLICQQMCAMFIISILMVLIDKKTHLSTNKVFTFFIEIFFIIIFVASLILIASVSSFARDVEFFTRFISMFKFLSVFGYLSSQSMLLSNISSYFIMPAALIITVLLFFVFSKVINKNYVNVLNAKNIDKVFTRKDKENCSQPKIKNKRVFSIEIKRNIKLISGVCIKMLISSVILLVIFITAVKMIELSPFFSTVSLKYKYMIIALASMFFNSSISTQPFFYAFSIEGINIQMLKSLPQKKLNLYFNKFLSINLLILPVSLILPITLSLMFYLPYYIVILMSFLSICSSLAINSINYFFGLIKPDFTITKDDVFRFRIMMLGSAAASEIIPALYVASFFVTDVFFTHNSYISLLVSPLIYLVLTATFFFLGKELFKSLMNQKS